MEITSQRMRGRRAAGRLGLPHAHVSGVVASPPTAPAPAGPSPLPAGTGIVIEVERAVNAVGLAGAWVAGPV